MGLEEDVSREQVGLTEEQKERILNEVERERRKVLVLGMVREGIRSTNTDIMIGTARALETLASTLPDEFVDMYRESLNGQDDRFNGHFVEALTGLVDARLTIAAELCETALDNKDRSIRYAAHSVVEALARAMPTKAAQLCNITLDDEFWPPNSVQRVTRTLSILVDTAPQMAIELYVKGLTSAKTTVRAKTAAELGALARVDFDKFLELYNRGLNDPEGDVMIETAKSVAAVVPINLNKAMELYEEGICNKEAFVRIGTAEALPTLIKCDSNRVIVLYERALKDKVDLVRIAAAEALPTLVLINPDKAAQLYARALKDREELVRQAAAAALPFLSSARPDSAARLYEKALRDKDGGVNMAAACGIDDLAAVRPSIAEELRKKALKSKCESVRDAAEGKLFYPTPLREGTAAERRYRELRREERKVITDEVERLLNILRRSPTEFIRAYQERATTREGLEGELKLDYAWEVTSKPLIHLIETIDAETLTPIYDEERTFIQAYLESRCIRLDGDKKKGVKEVDQLITELRRLVQNPDRDYGKLMRILEAGEARNLDEIIECCELDIPGFTIISKVSSAGGSSVVYAAIDERVKPRVGEPSPLVAIKLMILEAAMGANLSKNIEKGASGLRTIFLKDIENLETLSHPNIAKILGKGEYKDRIFIVQRYYEAGSLEDYLQEVDFMGAADKIIEGASYLHRRGLVHRDIKPSNIFLTWNQDLVVIGDLQTCRRPAELVMTIDEEGKLRGHGFTHGTSHSAPEVLVEHYAEQSADVYSLGLVLWRMLTGRKLPFSYSTEFFGSLEKENHRETHEVNIQKMLEELPDSTSEELKGVIRRCIEFDPKNRYADASLMLEEFRRAKQVSGQQYKTIRRSE